MNRRDSLRGELEYGGRVVNRAGLLTGKMHFAYPEQMQELLEKEGVKVEDDKVVEFAKLLWNPAVELGV